MILRTVALIAALASGAVAQAPPPVGQPGVKFKSRAVDSPVKPEPMPLLLAPADAPPRFEVEAPGLVAEGELYLLDGDTGKETQLPTKIGGDLMVYWGTQRSAKWTFAEVSLHNRGDTQAKLEVGLRLHTAFEPTEFFDGERVHEADKECKSDRFTGRFPLTTLANGKTCVALGYFPDQWLSYLRHSCLPRENGVTLETATRIVVDPGKSGKVDFVVGGFATKWGHYEALHWYYERFPAFFQPRSDVDPRANLNGGSYLAWTSRPNPEMCRRLRVGWDWCYAPFKRTGDIYGRPQFWDYTPARPHSGSRTHSIEKYHEARRGTFENGKLCDVAMMCYIPSQIWCEEALAREHYADALITDSRSKTYFDTPWVTGPDNELRMFPYMTSFGKQSRIDMAALVQENNIQGFAFDVANGGGKYFGPHVNECPGRAWDDRGVYVDEGVAIAKLMDWCHANKDSSGQTLAVVSNPGGSPCYLTPFRSDSAMIEADPTRVRTGAALTLRNFLGHKTMVFWENYELKDLLDYEQMSAEQMADALNRLADYTIIASLRIAAIPTPRVCIGIRKLARWLPLLTEIAQAGWQPVPAATCDAGLPISRSGSGLRQFLMTGNETGETISGTISAENSWFAGGAMLFMAEGQDEAENDIAADSTNIEFSLPSRGALVLRSALHLSPEPEGLKAVLSRQVDLDHERLRVALDSRQPAACVLGIPDWGRMTAVRVTLAGDDVPIEKAGQGWRSKSPIKLQGKQELIISLRSSVFEVSERDLLTFPWTVKNADGKVALGFAIQLGEDLGPAARYAAERLAAYFPYYYARAVEPKVELAPAPILAAAKKGQPHVSLQVNPELAMPCRIRRDASVLTVTGRTPSDVKQGVYRLLAALDHKYEYGGPLTGTVAIRTVGLAGKEVR